MTPTRPNILIMCMDQWDMHMELPEEVELPTLTRLESMGVTLDRQYCTVPICTPSRATMWTGQHAKNVGMWDNTNFPWIKPLSTDYKTLGTMMREQGYYTAFKGKWHLSDIPPATANALEPYGFSDYQLWGDIFGRPLEGYTHDANVADETVDWLRRKAPKDQPWLLISSMVNPHDIMYLADPDEGPTAGENAMFSGVLHDVQDVEATQAWWNPTLPKSLNDDLAQQPEGPRAYRDFIEYHYTKVPQGRDDIWQKRRNYLINCMRMVDAEFGKIVAELDRQNLWDNTVVIFTSDHGEMNGAHHLHQKGGIHFQEATVVNMTAVVPGGKRGVRSSAVGSHLDLVPTVLTYAGMSPDEIHAEYPDLRGRSLAGVFADPDSAQLPRGSAEAPGDGALIMWDGMHQQDPDWTAAGGMKLLIDLPEDQELRRQKMLETGRRYGAPDFTKRTFFRAITDGRYKLVRWFAPTEYGMPTTLEELYQTSDVTCHDLVKDPDELENIGNPAHPDYDPELIERLLQKLNALIRNEVGDDECPLDLDMFGTRDVTYRE